MAKLHGQPASGTILALGGRSSFDPQTGSVYEVEFIGGRDEMRLATVGWAQTGGRSRLDESGPLTRAVVVWSGSNRNPSDPSSTTGDEVPVDRYEVQRDAVTVSLFELPAVIREAELYVFENGAGTTIAGYRTSIENAARNGEPLPFGSVTNPYPIAQQLYKKLARGQDSFETFRVRFSRVRSYSPLYTGQSQLEAIPPIYRTATLIQREGIPIAWQQKLPADPGSDLTPSGTVWGWKVVDEATSYNPRDNRFEERKGWVFAAWDADIYPIL